MPDPDAERPEGNGLQPKAAKKAENKNTEPEEESGFFKFLKIMKTAKADLHKLTGSDEMYYDILKAHGVKKSNEVKQREPQKAVYRDMTKEIDRLKERKEAEAGPDWDSSMVACPDRDGETVEASVCAECPNRKGCPAHDDPF